MILPDSWNSFSDIPEFCIISCIFVSKSTVLLFKGSILISLPCSLTISLSPTPSPNLLRNIRGMVTCLLSRMVIIWFISVWYQMSENLSIWGYIFIVLYIIYSNAHPLSSNLQDHGERVLGVSTQLCPLALTDVFKFVVEFFSVDGRLWQTVQFRRLFKR